MNRESEPISRRQWLRRFLLWGGVGAAFASLGGILVDMWLAAGRFSPDHWTDVTDLRRLPVEGTVPFPTLRMALVLREGRLGAISLECTHLGCLVDVAGHGFTCPCHGSVFGPLGAVYTGPAPQPLRWYALELRGERVWLRTGRTHTAPRWLPLPGRPGEKGDA